MMKEGTLEKYPLWIVSVSNLLSFSIYAVGFFIMFQVHILLSFAWLLFVFFLEFRIIKNHCVNCYYWGKICGFGKGRISSALFKKGETEKFCAMEFTWKSMIPDLLVPAIPLLSGIVLLILDFRISVLLALILLVVLSTSGNGFVRGSLTCKYCKQREIGCPAEKLFDGKQSETI